MKRQLKNKGFTLIEIVMVLVLLGILAAVAVPKYYDLQDEALNRAAEAIVADVQSQMHSSFGKASSMVSPVVTLKDRPFR